MIPILSFLGGCVVLAFAADQFLKSSIVLAKRFGLSEMMIGVVLIGFGTSFAEIVVSAVAALKGQPQLAVGNVLGSNIANIGLVIGITALIKPLLVSSQFIKREFPVMLGATVLVGILLWNLHLTRLDGIILVSVLILHITFLFAQGPKDQMIAEESVDAELIHEPGMSLNRAMLMWPLGLIFLFVSSELIVDGATTIAHWFGLSEYLIGLTIVALGTSLPELATLVLSVMKEQHDMAVGTILGSNIFNLLAVLAVPAFIHPTDLPANFMKLDFPLLLGFTLLFYLFAVWPKHVDRSFRRLEGSILILSYIGYVVMMVVMQ